MGATSWKYFTQYKFDIKDAFANLRQQEFNAGRYGMNDNLMNIVEQKAKELNLPNDKLEEFKKAYQNLSRLKGKSKKTPKTIEQLLKNTKDNGTHSIIDIADIELSTDKNVSGTLSSDDLLELFGTEHPTHEMVNSKADELINFRKRGLCTYVVVYHKQTPTEIFFAGYSGD